MIETRIKEAQEQARLKELEARNQRKNMYIEYSKDNEKILSDQLTMKETAKSKANSIKERLEKTKEFREQIRNERVNQRVKAMKYKEDLGVMEEMKREIGNGNRMTREEKKINLKNLHVGLCLN